MNKLFFTMAAALFTFMTTFMTTNFAGCLGVHKTPKLESFFQSVPLFPYILINWQVSYVSLKVWFLDMTGSTIYFSDKIDKKRRIYERKTGN